MENKQHLPSLEGKESLAISRNEKQSIVINESIVIRVTQARAGRARLVIHADREIDVRRAELSPRGA